MTSASFCLTLKWVDIFWNTKNVFFLSQLLLSANCDQHKVCIHLIFFWKITYEKSERRGLRTDLCGLHQPILNYYLQLIPIVLCKSKMTQSILLKLNLFNILPAFESVSHVKLSQTLWQSLKIPNPPYVHFSQCQLW